MDFIHQNLKNEEAVIQSHWVYGLYPSSGQLLRIAIFKGSNIVGVSLYSPEDGNSSSFRNSVISSYLEFRTMDTVPRSHDSECHTQSSQPFIFYSILLHARQSSVS
jgi:hypothetical protein